MGNLGYLLTPIIAATAAVILIALVAQGALRDRSGRAFLAVLVFLALWATSTFWMRSSTTEAGAVTWNRIVGSCLLGMFVSFAGFCHLYLGRTRRWPLVLLYAAAAVVAATTLFSDVVVTSMTRERYGWAPRVGAAGMAMFAGVYLLICSSVVRLVLAWRREVAGDKRRRLLLLAVAGLLPLVGILADGFTDLPPVLIWANLAFCTICSVAILRYRLFDLPVLARRGIARLVISILVAAPYIGIVVAMNDLLADRGSLMVVYAAGTVAFAAAMWPVYQWAGRVADRLFRGDRSLRLEALRGLGHDPGALDGFPEAAARSTDVIHRALGASCVHLLQPLAGSPALHLVASDGKPCVPSKPILGESSPVVEWLRTRPGVLTQKAMAVEPLLHNIPRSERAALQELRATVLAPLLTPRGGLAGVFVLGPKVARPSYNREDLQLLESLGGEVAMALENARLYRDALRARETLEAWLNSLPDAVMIVDAGGVIRFLNGEGVRRFGSRAGQRSFLIAEPPSLDADPRRFTETIRGVEYEIAAAPLADSGGQLQTVFVMRDISVRKEEQEERRRLEANARLASHLASIGEMASGIAHEINNPLTVVIGYSQFLGEKEISPLAREAVEHILQGSARVAAIVRRLLTFARQEKTARRLVDLNDVIRSTLLFRDYALRTGNITVTTRLDPRLPFTMADAQQMQQVLLNLVMNAETAMKKARGKGHLTVASESTGATIHVTVRDDGPGVPVEIQDRIFDPFFTTAEVGEGTGLGLSVCHGIVREHQGRIWVRNGPAGGAEFHVDLPVVQGDPAALSEGSGRASTRPSSTRVLVLDDEPGVRKLVRSILQAEGHEVDEAADGQAAVELVSSHRYGLVLLDIRMPGMSGIEVYHRIKEAARSVEAGIIFLTGDVMNADTREFLERSGVPTVMKPFQSRELLDAVERVLVRVT